MVNPRYLDRPDGERIAYRRTLGISPGVVFCCGFMSDMNGLKAATLEAFCRDHGRAFVRFDYLGNGQSSGAFEAGTIGRWLDDTLAVLDELTQGPQILVGSSMGGWISLLAALARKTRVLGLLLLAPAADFTARILAEELSADERQDLERTGRLLRPSAYGAEPYSITRRLLDEGNQHLLLDRPPIDLRCPVRILHGMRDPDVAWQESIRLMAALGGTDVTLNLLKQGDHRLSEPTDLRLLCQTLEALWDHQ